MLLVVNPAITGGAKTGPATTAAAAAAASATGRINLLWKQNIYYQYQNKSQSQV
jgi:hypothetical protein